MYIEFKYGSKVEQTSHTDFLFSFFLLGWFLNLSFFLRILLVILLFVLLGIFLISGRGSTDITELLDLVTTINQINTLTR
jgi:hypothetical protein